MGRAIYRWMLAASIMLLFLGGLAGGGHHAIQENTQALAKPIQLWRGVINREWQPFLEQRFMMHIHGLRAFLILSYNEARHRLFPSRPNAGYVWTPELGYYPVDSIRRLNQDVLRHDVIEQHYQRAARRLRILQEILSHHGVTMIVVAPPPKARIYPEYIARYLIVPSASIMNQAISYGDVLEKNGVNVLNVQRAFLEGKSSSPWAFFATTGFHWNFWAACTETDAILRRVETLTQHSFFKVDCSDVEYGRSKGADADIAAILNIFSTQKVIGETPFPRFVQRGVDSGYAPKMIIIGDSFSDQILHSLLNSLPEMRWEPSWLIRYDGFSSRQTFGMDGGIKSQTALQHNEALSEILTKEILVIEVSDGVTYREAAQLDSMEHGATRTLLGEFLKRGMHTLDDFLTSGWRSTGKKQWRTTGSIASFAISPSANGDITELVLDVESQRPYGVSSRRVDVLLDGMPIGQASLAPGRGTVKLTLPSVSQWQDALVSEVSLRDPSGHPLDLILHAVRNGGLGAEFRSVQQAAANMASTKKKADHTGFPSINLMKNVIDEEISVTGLSDIESNDKGSWRWATGPVTRLKFYVDPSLSEAARYALFRLALKNGVSIPGQAVTIKLNDKEIHRFSSSEIASRELIDADMALLLSKGMNVLELGYSDWNHGSKDYSPDPRKLAVVVMDFSLASYPAGQKFPNKGGLLALREPPASPQKWPVDLFAKEIRADIEVIGLSDLESNATDSWRWATGPSTRIKFFVNPDMPESARQLLLKFAFKNGVPIPDQSVDILLNGRVIHRFSAKEIGVQKMVEADLAISAEKGNNVLEFRYLDCNHCKKNYGSNDPRKLAVVVTRLSLSDTRR